MQKLVDFFSHPFFMIVGGVFSLITVLGLVGTIYFIVKGILPIWYRFGIAFSRKKIAVFADKKFNELKNILVDSGIFQENKIIQINKLELKKAKDISFYLIYYWEYKDYIDDIISLKDDSDALIIYSPQENGFIDQDVLKKLNSQRNTIIVNFRGRLLNDIIISMISTGFAK